MKKRITFDFETRSACDLKRSGAYKYSLDPSTRATCLAAKLHGEKLIHFLDYYSVNRPWREQPSYFRQLWSGWIVDEFEFSAQNVFFDRCIYHNVLVKRLGWPEIPPRQFRDIAAKAAACALPRGLEKCAEAMRLHTQKDKRGFLAMMMTCRPTKEWTAWRKKQDYNPFKLPEPLKFHTPQTVPGVFQTLYEYCKIDVQAEEELDDALPDLLPEEQEVWFLNQELNWRGLRIDLPTVEKIVAIMAGEEKKKKKELDSLTMGLVTKPGAIKSILEFLEIEGVSLPNLRKKTVEEILKEEDISHDTRRLLELRQALSLTSTKKYHSFVARASGDRVRDLVMYHGASTGRDTGTGVQPHNLPKNLIKQEEIDYIIDMLQEAE